MNAKKIFGESQKASPECGVFPVWKHTDIPAQRVFTEQIWNNSLYSSLFARNTPNFSPRKKALPNGSMSEADINKIKDK